MCIRDSLRAEDNNYTSQINITLSSELVGTDIECSNDGGLSVTSVESLLVFITGACLASLLA